MKTNIYKDNITLIVRESDIFRVQHDILDSNYKGIKVTTLNRFIQSFTSLKTNWTIKYQIQNKFKSIIHELHYFKSSALSSAFIEECLSFLNELHFYDIPLSDLPTQTPTYLELKKLLETIYDIQTKSSIQIEVLNHLPSLNDIYIDIQYPSYKEKQVIDILQNKGAICVQNLKHTPIYNYYYANNARCEVEAIAQQIIRDKKDVNQIMIAYCDSKYNEIISSVFDRYQIPIHLNQMKSSSLAFKCATLLEFSLNPNPSTFLDCLTQGCFKNVEKLIEIQNIYPYNYNENYPNLNNITLNTDIFNMIEINQLITLIEQAQIQKDAIYQSFDQLVNYADFKELFITIDEILRNNIQEKEIKTLYQIQSIFRDSLPYLKDKEDLQLLIDEIKKIKTSIQTKRYNAIHVIPYSQVNTLLPTTYICGATQTSFNEFNPLNGIFDETYVSNIKNYPTLMQRYEHAHLALVNKIKSGNEIIVSFPQSDYLGKNFEVALDIENLLNMDSKEFPLIKQKEANEHISNLTSTDASSIYTKNHVIKGSISSLEKYVGCPYAYFLRYGCRIQEPIESGFNVQKIGTLNHFILETLVNRYSKEYSKANIHEVIQIVDASIEDMKTVFPHLQFDIIRNRLIENMELNLFILDDMEKASSMTPTYSEYKWNKDVQVDDVTLRLVGYVDRIDTAPTTFRIIDYKSSQKNLDKEKVFSGQQLQLCTYLMQIRDELQLRPLGGFYYSFMNSKFELPYQKLSRSKKVLEEISKEMIEKEIIKNNRLQGWIFDDNVEIMDENGAHVKGISNTKNKGVYARNVYKLDEVSECITEMMKMIVSNILSGNIQCEPNEAACLFCKYKPICRFNGTPTEKKQLVELPACMRKEKDDE